MASILKLEWCGGILQAWLGEDLPRLRLTQKEEPAYGACPSPKEDFLHEGNSPIHLPHYEKTNVESRLTKPLEHSVLSPRFLSLPRRWASQCLPAWKCKIDERAVYEKGLKNLETRAPRGSRRWLLGMIGKIYLVGGYAK
jgi:hypothetical protein